MSIILVNPQFFIGEGPSRVTYFDTAFQQHSAKARSTFPGEHMGFMSMISYCRSVGIDVHCVDAIVDCHRSEQQTFAAIEDMARREGPPALIGFSGSSLVFEQTRYLARRCRETWPDARIILGHDFASLNFKTLLENYPDIDYVCKNDGEHLFAQLADCVLNNRSPEWIPGLAWRSESGEVRHNPLASVSLDELPWMARDQTKPVLALGLSAGVMSSRGCPYRCTFCTTGQTTAERGEEGYRERMVESVVEEIIRLRDDFGVSHVTIGDDLFVSAAPKSQERAASFAKLMIERNAGVTWMIDCRVDSIEPKLFKLMHEAGLRKVFIGVESGSNKQLTTYKKRYLLPQNVSTASRLQMLSNIGIEVLAGIIMFHPTVTQEELLESLETVDNIGYEGVYQFFNSARAYPGTPLYQQYEALGVLTKGEWPTRGWDFKDPRVGEMCAVLNELALRPGCGMKELRAEFVRRLEMM